MKRMLILGAAIVFICLMISACEGTVEEETQESDVAVSETEEPEPESTAERASASEAPVIGNRAGTLNNRPNLKNGFQKMQVYKKLEQADIFCVHLHDGEDNEAAWEKIESCAQFKRRKKVFMIDNVYLKIPYYRMNREYLKWLKKEDSYTYKNIKRDSVWNASITVFGSDDFEKIQMIYKSCPESDDSYYIGKYSVYNYVAGETLPVEKTEIPEKGIEAEKFMWEIGEVGYDCPWYLHQGFDTAGIEIGMSMELFRKYFGEVCMDETQSEFSYYVVQAEKGKWEELKRIVEKYFSDAWITSGGAYYE